MIYCTWPIHNFEESKWATHNAQTQRRLALVWGVQPLLLERSMTSDEMMERAIEAAQAAHVVKDGDLLVMTAGVPVGIPGRTNMLQVRRVGERYR